MSPELSPLLVAATSLGFFHTLFGPDHYLPFIVMGKARQWSLRRTMSITFLCGLGHVLSSVVLGTLGVVLGVAVHRLVAIESFRGEVAAWALTAFGLVYCLWGIRQAVRNQPHRHSHFHAGASEHEHAHVHQSDHLHVHIETESVNITPWILFTIFVFGPCEPLIPLLMYPAAQGSVSELALVTLAFGATTIATMMGVVLVSMRGIQMASFAWLERYMHCLAGATLFLCGMCIQFLGL